MAKHGKNGKHVTQEQALSPEEQWLHESRRRFLKQAAAVGVTLAAAPLFSFRKAQAQSSYPALDPAAGMPRPWQLGQSVYGGDVSLVNGNFHLSHSVCGWGGKGGGLFFALFFNSQGAQNGGPLGPKWNHSFSWRVTGTNPVTLIAADGNQTKYTLSGSSYIAPAGVYDRLVKNADNTWTLTTKGGVQYRFRADGCLGSIVDSNGNTITCTWRGGNLTQVTDAAGRSLVLAYSGANIVSVTDLENRTWTLSYDGSGRLYRISDPTLSGVTYYTQLGYTANGNNVSSVRNRLGKTWSYTYGGDNGLLSMTDPDGSVWSYMAAKNNPPGGADGADASIRYTTGIREEWPLDVVGVGVVTDPTNSTVQHGFDKLGRVVAIKGATDRRAIFTYDDRNNQCSLETDSGAKWQFRYDRNGNIISKVDPLSAVTRATYDNAGRVLTIQSPNQMINHVYDDHGNRTSTVDQFGSTRQAFYNTSGQLTQLMDAQGQSMVYSYDIFGDLISINDSHGNTTKYEYQDSSNRVVKRVDNQGRVTVYGYDDWGRLIDVAYTTTNAGISRAFDAEGRLIRSTDGTGTRAYKYDVWGRRVSMTDPMGNTAARYDKAGRMVSQTDVSGRTHRYSYDKLKRLSQVSDGKHAVRYEYTRDSRVETAIYSNGTYVEYEYDVVGHKTSVLHRRSSDNNLIIGYKAIYDTAGRIIQMTEQPSGAITSYYYEMGMLLREDRIGERPYLSEYRFDANGNPAWVHQAEGNVTSHECRYSYDEASRLQHIHDGITGITESYNWNADGTLKSHISSTHRRLFSYDEEKRLIKVHRDSGSGNMVLEYEYGYAADGGKRWRKDYAKGIWTWFPCGVACCAGDLVEMQSDLQGKEWLVSATYVRGVDLVARSGKFHHINPLGASSLMTDVDGRIVSASTYDFIHIKRYDGGAPVQMSLQPLTACAVDEDELTIPGYNYCGPNAGPAPGPPVNQLDQCCKDHDDCFAAQNPPCTIWNQCFRVECKDCTCSLCRCARGVNCGNDLGCQAAQFTVIAYACNLATSTCTQ